MDTEKLDGFLEMEKNWDGYGGDPIDPQAVGLAKQIVSALDALPALRDSLDFSPNPDGGVDVEYEINGYDVLINITPPPHEED